MSSMIAEHGLEKAEKWANGLVSNLARRPQGNDGWNFDTDDNVKTKSWHLVKWLDFIGLRMATYQMSISTAVKWQRRKMALIGSNFSGDTASADGGRSETSIEIHARIIETRESGVSDGIRVDEQGNDCS